jgi:hypothetical protein
LSNNWIASYLKSRNQSVFVGSSFSDTKFINAVVPQGSVLGLLLFLIYVNDIAENLLNLTRLFADDSSLSVTSDDSKYIEMTLNIDLKTITEWADQWLVTFNPNKTEVLFCSLIRNERPFLYFNNIQLNNTQHHRHLGLTLSHDGTWHEHINNITNSASKIFGSMRLLKFKLNRTTLNQINLTILSNSIPCCLL